MNRVGLVPTFSLMNLEGKWCPPLADEPGVELVPTFWLMNLEWNWCPPLAWWTRRNWCPPLAWWTRRGRRGGGWWESWSRPAGTRRTRPNVSTRPPFLCWAKPSLQIFLCLGASLLPITGGTFWKKLLQTTYLVFANLKSKKKYLQKY